MLTSLKEVLAFAEEKKAAIPAEKSPIPVVPHLDHGQSLEQVRMALDCGFTSVMIDGSKLPFHENVEISKRALEMARAAGATVEAELGCILGVEDDISHDDSKPFLVRTEDVEAFHHNQKKNPARQDSFFDCL